MDDAVVPLEVCRSSPDIFLSIDFLAGGGSRLDRKSGNEFQCSSRTRTFILDGTLMYQSFQDNQMEYFLNAQLDKCTLRKKVFAMSNVTWVY
jgi:hypothetical protein